MSDLDRLSSAWLEKGLSDYWKSLITRVFEEVTSTNTLAKQAIASEGTSVLFAANSQTDGRGRRGRSFYSPSGLGLYFSLAFPWNREERPVLITTMAAVAVCRVIEREFGISVKIKWVNDIYYGGRKICGILTETVTNSKSACLDSLVVGIGLNLVQPDRGYPAEIRQIAGAVADEASRLNRNELIVKIVNELGAMLAKLPDRAYLDEYRSRCFLLGHEVMLDSGKKIIPFDVSEEGALLYYENGSVCTIESGEISIVRIKK